MVPPIPSGFIPSAFLNPPLKLILPKAPDATDFESGEFAFARKVSDSEGVDPEDLGDLIRGERFDDRLHNGASS